MENVWKLQKKHNRHRCEEREGGGKVSKFLLAHSFGELGIFLWHSEAFHMQRQVNHKFIW